MDTKADLPMKLWKANLDLQLRIGQLIQDSGREWMDLGAHAVGEGMQETDTELRDLLRGGDWHALASWPANAFWRQAEVRLGDGQELARIAISAQNAFARGLVDAVRDWQDEVAAAVADTAKGKDAVDGWQAMFEPWLALQSAFSPPAAAPSSPKGSRKRGG